MFKFNNYIKLMVSALLDYQKKIRLYGVKINVRISL